MVTVLVYLPLVAFVLVVLAALLVAVRSIRRDRREMGGSRRGHLRPDASFEDRGSLGRPTVAGRQILLTIVTLNIWMLVWGYRQHRDIKAFSGDGVGGPVGLLIFVLAGIVTPFLLAGEINTNLYARAGEDSPVTAATGFWVLLPGVGFLIWYVKVQAAINKFWIQRGATLS